MVLFKNRREAGQVLGEILEKLIAADNLLVLGLPRGGMPVAFEVARSLNAPLDVFLVRKLGVPDQEELAMGAIASGGVRVLNQDVITYLELSGEVIEAVAAREQRELLEKERLYRDNRDEQPVAGKTVVLVDDGLATGASMRAAVTALKQRHAGRIIVAVPVAAPSTCQELEQEAERVVCVATPEPFKGVGVWYEDFSQVTDEEVRDLLSKAAGRNYDRK